MSLSHATYVFCDRDWIWADILKSYIRQDHDHDQDHRHDHDHDHDHDYEQDQGKDQHLECKCLVEVVMHYYSIITVIIILGPEHEKMTFFGCSKKEQTLRK